MGKTGTDGMRQIHIKLPATLHKDLKVQAALRETTIQEYVVRAIEDQIKSDKSETAEEGTGKR